MGKVCLGLQSGFGHAERWGPGSVLKEWLKASVPNISFHFIILEYVSEKCRLPPGKRVAFYRYRRNQCCNVLHRVQNSKNLSRGQDEDRRWGRRITE